MRLLRWRGRLRLLLSAVGPGATLPLATVGEKIWGFNGIVGLTNQRLRGVNHQKWGYHPITLGRRGNSQVATVDCKWVSQCPRMSSQNGPCGWRKPKLSCPGQAG